ncbi:3-keto-5-aminohexanoate cleavage protein [Thermodesulfobacteriota bacterium]
MDKRIISVAVTGGIHTPTMSEYLPYKPEDIARHAIDSWREGAAVVHIHARDPNDGRPSSDINLFKEIVERIRNESDMIIAISTGGGAQMTLEERLSAIPALKPELASFNQGSINFGLFPLLQKHDTWKHDWEPELLNFTRDWVFKNTFEELEGIAKMMKDYGTKPELEVYDTGMLYNVQYLHNLGLLEEPLYIQFVTGILGGLQSNPFDLMNFYNTAERIFGHGNFVWSIIGAGRQQFNMTTMGLILGGNIRVGLEDNLYLEKGVLAKSSAEQAAKMVRIMKELGLEPASPEDAREMLNIKKK